MIGYTRSKDERKFYKELNDKVDKTVLPKGFYKWLDNYLFKDDCLAFYEKVANNCYFVSCQHCKERYYIYRNIKHNDFTKCPKCKTRVRFRNSKYLEHVAEKKYCSILQKTFDGYVLREFRVTRVSDNLDYKFQLEELERCFTDDNLLTEVYFRIYCDDWNFGVYNNMGWEIPTHLPLYYGNLKSILSF